METKTIKSNQVADFSILNSVAEHSLKYLNEIPSRRVFPTEQSLKQLNKFTDELPESGIKNEDILDQLKNYGSINTVVSNGGRYFGFVFGGSLPASLAANWLVSTWDQNGCFKISSPVGAHLEKITGNWLIDLLQYQKDPLQDLSLAQQWQTLRVWSLHDIRSINNWVGI